MVDITDTIIIFLEYILLLNIRFKSKWKQLWWHTPITLMIPGFSFFLSTSVFCFQYSLFWWSYKVDTKYGKSLRYLFSSCSHFKQKPTWADPWMPDYDGLYYFPALCVTIKLNRQGWPMIRNWSDAWLWHWCVILNNQLI